MKTNNLPPIILASTSNYRRLLLERLNLPFSVSSPNFDEALPKNERPEEIAEKFAIAKTRSLSKLFPNHLIIGSDQTATRPDGILLTKPGTYENAVQQLSSCSGQSVRFFTGLAILNSATGKLQHCVESYSVKFRHLSIDQIERYIGKEKPLDCAGSFKAEGLGIALFESMEGKDPNTLIGLPLIKLVTYLHNEGYEIL